MSLIDNEARTVLLDLLELLARAEKRVCSKFAQLQTTLPRMTHSESDDTIWLPLITSTICGWMVGQIEFGSTPSPPSPPTSLATSASFAVPHFTLRGNRYTTIHVMAVVATHQSAISGLLHLHYQSTQKLSICLYKLKS